MPLSAEPALRPATRAADRIAAWLRRPWTSAAALTAGVVLDAITRTRSSWPVPVLAALDEPAHLATAWIALAAVLPPRYRALAPWALGGAVLIDLDHLPLYAWGVLADAHGGRPVTHSLVTAAALAALALPRWRLRTPLLGLGLGVVLHLLRDLGTGPGVALVWPISPNVVLVPYRDYLLPLVAVALIATLLNALRRSRRHGRPAGHSARERARLG